MSLLDAAPSLMRAVRSLAAPAAKTALLRLGGYAAFRRIVPSRDAAILRYHAICGEEGASYAGAGISVSPAAFERHVRYLAANYRVLPLPEVVTYLRNGRTLPSNTVAITFDDGYVDNLEAARLLSRHGLSATFFITAGCVEGEPFWPAELRTLIAAVRDPMLRLRIDGDTLQIPVADDADRRRAVKTLTTTFKAHPIRVRESLREQLRRAAGDPPVPSCILTWEQLAEMQRLGMTIGAHTVTHPNLPNAGPVDAWREIEGSKTLLERRLGTPVTMFAYPNGGAERYMTPKIALMVKSAGFAAAATSRNGFAGLRSDPFALERVQVQERLEDLVFSLEIERLAFAPVPRRFEQVEA